MKAWSFVDLDLIFKLFIYCAVLNSDSIANQVYNAFN